MKFRIQPPHWFWDLKIFLMHFEFGEEMHHIEGLCILQLCSKEIISKMVV